MQSRDVTEASRLDDRRITRRFSRFTFSRFTKWEWAGVLFLALQLASVGYAQFIPERFFCWAPFDIHTHYVVEVTIDGEKLDQRETTRRYRYSAQGWEPRSIHNLFSMIAQYESSYGAADDARVLVDYSINGHPREQWTWPSP